MNKFKKGDVVVIDNPTYNFSIKTASRLHGNIGIVISYFVCNSYIVDCKPYNMLGHYYIKRGSLTKIGVL